MHRSLSRLSLAAAIGVLLASLVGAPAGRAETGGGGLDAETRQRIEAYLNGLDTLQARFVQISDDGGIAQGTLYLDRPGRMRIDYDPPAQVVLVADGSWLIHVDYALDSATHLPLSSTPAYFFLRERVRLEDEVTVTTFERGPGVLRLTLVKSAEPEAGALALTFADGPLELRQWTVIDPQGVRVQVSLTDLRTGIDLDPEIFELKLPDFGVDAAQ